MGLSNAIRAALAFSLLGSGCLSHHEAKVQSALLPPPAESPVRHTGRLWVELGDATWQRQCRAPAAQREVCFAGVRRAAFGALERGLWTSFSEVTLWDGDALAAGDYLLQLDISLDAMPPGPDGPGWSAVASGRYRLSRDGKLLLEEKLGSRSRASFAYGSALGVGAGEVLDAFVAHVAQSLATVPEDRPLRPAPLPSVVVETIDDPRGSGAAGVPVGSGESVSPSATPAGEVAPAAASPSGPSDGSEVLPVAPAPPTPSGPGTPLATR